MAQLQVENKENEVLLNTPNRKEILREGPRMLHDSKCGVLGRGAYGTVFKAVFKTKKVAVKIVKNSSDACKQSVRNEAHILGWRHRNLIRVLQIESTPDFGIVIMERFSGQCLQLVLDAVVLPLEHRVHISLDILEALAYCHKRQLLHLDVKPQNVLVCFCVSSIFPGRKLAKRNYVCKLCDFGSSLNLRDHQEHMNKRAIKGTIRYMAPEALREEPLTSTADVFSLGITMWQLKAQRLPYHWIECNEAVAYQVVKHDIRPDSPVRLSPTITSQPHEKCCCESLSSVVTFDSVQQIESLLKSGKKHRTSTDKVVISQCDFPLKRRAVIYSRAALKNLNVKSNFEGFDSLHSRVKPPESLLAINTFKKMSSTVSEHKEQIYTSIYKTCWETNPSSRLSTVKMRVLLEELL